MTIALEPMVLVGTYLTQGDAGRVDGLFAG